MKMTFTRALAIGAGLTALAGVQQQALAHPSLSIPNMTEGTSIYTAVTVTHGCTAFTPAKPVTGTVQLFPTGADAAKKGPGRITKPDGTKEVIQGGVAAVRQTKDSGSYEVGTATTLAEEIVSANAGNTGVTTLGDKFRAVSSRDVFNKLGVVKSLDGATRVGAWSYQGKLDPDMYGQTSFRANAGGIWLRRDKYARSLKVRVPAIDVCKADRKNTGNPAGYVNLWINSQTPKFNFPDAHGIKPEDNFWMTLSINRDTTKNPFPDSCKSDTSKQYDVVVTPTFEEIDGLLKIPGYAFDQ